LAGAAWRVAGSNIAAAKETAIRVFMAESEAVTALTGL
jgi:hypothetical protein